MLTIKKSEMNDVVTIALEGRLDTNTAPQLEAEIQGVSENAALVIDLEKLEYVSSAGLRVLLFAQKKVAMEGSLKLIHLCEAVTEIFEVTGFIDIFTIE